MLASATESSPEAAVYGEGAVARAAHAFRQPASILRHTATGAVGVATTRTAGPGEEALGVLPPLYPEWLGDRAFNEVHGLRFSYVAGAMANGIATSDIVIAMARAGMLGFFGSAGLSPDAVNAGLDRIEGALGSGSVSNASWGANLIHSPNEPDLEAAVADLFIRRGVRRVSASAYMGLTEPLVRYAFSGVRRQGGGVARHNYVFAKISRPEVARHMMAPPPSELLESLVQKGQLTGAEAALAKNLPVAEDITVESDSGGHTDNQPLGAVFPVIAMQRDKAVAEFGRAIRVGAAGGLGTPASIAAAFGYGADFVLTGSVNQSAVESGLSVEGKKLLAQASMADVGMAPAADMFEMGVEVQVLKRGTMFGPRAHRLYAAYRQFDSIEAMPEAFRANLEKQVLGDSCAAIWERTRAFFAERDPREVERAEKDPKHRMALVFRWYLGLSSKWAIAGEASRRLDYQIWCGPAMGAFNDWVRGSFLEAPENRSVAQIALNLLEGAAVVTRAHQLRSYGAPVPASAFAFEPRPLAIA
ncbi:MAG: PfaD family polyunsaturated fatty acid/polyketide biosynthesis protein [Myxococcota bacterium]